MRNAQGVVLISDPAAGLQETDTFTCWHCNRVVQVPPHVRIEQVGDFCRQCMKMICDKCAGRPCRPFLKKIEQMEERYYRRRQLEKMAGL